MKLSSFGRPIICLRLYNTQTMCYELDSVMLNYVIMDGLKRAIKNTGTSIKSPKPSTTTRIDIYAPRYPAKIGDTMAEDPAVRATETI